MTDDDAIRNAIESLPPLREVIAASRLDARKSLGQNFLLDLNLTMRIARAALPFTGTVIEIGPGPGGLTRALLMAGAGQSAGRLVAVEKDPRATEALAPLIHVAQGRLTVVCADALEADIAAFTGNGGGQEKVKIVANLPYNIATPLLLKWLGHIDRIDSMTLMFQKEVAQRITAAPDTPGYGRLAVICGWLCEAKALFDIPPDAFTPRPKVTSTVVQLTPRPAPLAEAGKSALEDITRITFGQRRKMLRASLKAETGGDASGLLDAAGIDGTRRPENLTIEEFCALARLLNSHRKVS